MNIIFYALPPYICRVASYKTEFVE